MSIHALYDVLQVMIVYLWAFRQTVRPVIAQILLYYNSLPGLLVHCKEKLFIHLLEAEGRWKQATTADTIYTSSNRAQRFLNHTLLHVDVLAISGDIFKRQWPMPSISKWRYWQVQAILEETSMEARQTWLYCHFSHLYRGRIHWRWLQ